MLSMSHEGAVTNSKWSFHLRHTASETNVGVAWSGMESEMADVETCRQNSRCRANVETGRENEKKGLRLKAVPNPESVNPP